MEIHAESKDGVAVISLMGELLTEEFAHIERQVNELIMDDAHHLVFDLADCEMLSSQGLGLLLGATKRVRRMDGDVKVVNVNERILNIFRLTNVDTVIGIYPTVESAVQSFM